MLLWVLIGRAALQALHTSVMAQTLGEARTLLVVALAWMVLRVLDLMAQRIADRLETAGLSGAKVLLRPVTRLAKLIILVGAVLLWLENIGYEVTTLLAGLSISGVAVALASQKTLENIFGAVTLYSAQPVKVGDFCRFGDQVGTVEEIGLRATLIRTLERSVISVPNAEFASMHLDNLSRRDRYWYHPRLKLRVETTPDQIRYLLVEARKMLYAHPKVLPEPLWVRFTNFGDTSLDLDVFCYTAAANYDESLEIAEDLNLRIMDLVAEAGTELTVPTQIQYEVPGTTLDEARRKNAEARVKEWRENRALYLPNFPPEAVAKVKGSLDYPPAGSPLSGDGKVALGKESHSRTIKEDS
jgi:MscS family membrane protein